MPATTWTWTCPSLDSKPRRLLSAVGPTGRRARRTAWLPTLDAGVQCSMIDDAIEITGPDAPLPHALDSQRSAKLGPLKYSLRLSACMIQLCPSQQLRYDALLPEATSPVRSCMRGGPLVTLGQRSTHDIICIMDCANYILSIMSSSNHTFDYSRPAGRPVRTPSLRSSWRLF